MRKPDFDNLLMVLNREKPSRKTLFEFAISPKMVEHITSPAPRSNGDLAYRQWFADGVAKLGYDFVCFHPTKFYFKRKSSESHEKKSSRSLNETATITDWDSFEQYKWNEPEDFPCSLDGLKLPDGMKVILFSSDGVLENTIGLFGYDNLCYALYEDEELVSTVFQNVGERLYRYYAEYVHDERVGALLINDDLGFNTQTLLSPELLRKYVFPWHKRFAELAHREGKPALLHSCGNLSKVYDDIIDVQKFDGKHSYEDGIQPVEEAYKMLHKRIAVLGGIDVDFLCRRTPEEIEKRCREMLDLAEADGGYALGTGNSVPTYMPVENYFAMLKAIED